MALSLCLSLDALTCARCCPQLLRMDLRIANSCPPSADDPLSRRVASRASAPCARAAMAMTDPTPEQLADIGTHKRAMQATRTRRIDARMIADGSPRAAAPFVCRLCVRVAERRFDVAISWVQNKEIECPIRPTGRQSLYFYVRRHSALDARRIVRLSFVVSSSVHFRLLIRRRVLLFPLSMADD